jgi:hypothetical protein
MNLFEQFGNSLWNFRSYKSLSQTKGGKSFLYILLLFLLVYLIGSIYISAQIGNVIGYLGEAMQENVPDFRLSGGKFSFSGPMPYRIEEDGFLLVIDTTGQTSMDDFDNVPNGIYITEDEMMTFQLGKTEIVHFSDLAPLEISKDQIVSFLPGINAIVWIFIAIWFLFAFAGKLFGILILALIAMIATAMFNQKLTFLNQWNIAIYASTLPMLVKLVNTLLDGPLSGFMFILYWGLAITYVFLGIYHMPKADASPGDGPAGSSEPLEVLPEQTNN